MNPKPRFIFTLCLILLAVVMAHPALANEYRDEAIALWVADQIKATQSFEMPIRHFVDKATLGLAFEVGNKQSYYRWQEEYGEAQADRIMEKYLNNIVGLFNERTEIIYVGNFMDTCSQEAIFAHEMVHYFQHIIEGVIEPGSYEEEMQRLRREMEAYNIEEKYRNAFCKESKNEVSDTDL